MFFLAIRHLGSRRRQTILTLLGILLGTAAFVVISGFMLGFREYFVDQLINNDLQIRISAKEDLLTEHSLDTAFFPNATHVFWQVPPSGRKDSPKIKNPQGWYQILDADTRVTAFSPQLSTQVILTRSGTSLTAKFLGSDPNRQQQVTNIRKYMTQGHFSDIGSGGNRIVAGEDLLKKMGARVSETILISNGRGEPVPFKIVGAFQVGIAALDESTVFGALSDAQAINQTPSQINVIAIRIKNIDEAAAMAKSWSTLSDDKVESWDTINANFLNIFHIQDAIRYLMTGSILIVAGFSIYNILNMVVTQKRKEIAILRSMGYEPRDILNLFLVQGVILGAIGGALGLLVGFLACLKLSHTPFGGGPLGKGSGYMTVSFGIGIYIRGFLLSFSASVLASALPARAAGKMTPIDVIRLES